MMWSRRLLAAVVSVGLVIVGASLALASGASVPRRDKQLRPHAGVEVSTLRTEFTQTHLLSDGTYETRLSSLSLNYRDASGSWRRIDNDLVRAANGSLKNGANSVAVQIPKVANGPVRFADGARALSFSLATADDDVVAEATGKVARFEDAVEGVDVSYEVVGKALKETLTLGSADVPSVYRFDVESGDLMPRLAASGAVHFVDGEGRRQLGFAAPWMRDANGAVSQAVAYEIEQRGQSSRIALRVDEAWLRAPERRFPVIVDPTIYRPTEHICEIRSGASANTSYCDSTLGSLRAGRNSSGIVHRNLFDLEDLSLVVPDYAQVLSSYLAVYMIGQSPVETSQIDLHHLTRNFVPGATWNTTDGRTAWSTAGGDYNAVREARASTPGTPPDDQLAFDMTELAQRIVGHAEPSGNLLLKAADESRTHLDTYWWPEVMVRWAHRTGLSPRYAFERRELSDGSTLEINLANGNIVLLSNDIDLESDAGSFTVGRYFNNKNLGESAGTYGRGSRGDFGSISLERNAQDGSYIFFGPGADDGVFHKQIDGTFTPPPGLDATLREQLDGTVTIDFSDSTEIWTFDTTGRLVQTRQDYGYTIDGTYGSNGLATLRDSLGHAATFAYDGAGDMRTITDEQSVVHRYDYDSSHRLITYTAPTSAQTRYAYDSSNRLQRITLPDRTALRISYYSGSTSPQYVTPVDASGVDQPATVYDGDFEYTTVQRPSPQPRNVYFYDPYTLVTDLIQTGSAAAIAAIPDLDGGYTRGDRPLTVDVSAAQVPDGIQLTELEVDGVEVDSDGPAPCNQWTCPTRVRETLSYDPRSDPEGTYTYQVNTVDGDNERTESATWRVGIDRTGPSAADSLLLEEFVQLGPATFTWEPGPDPQIVPGVPGAGLGRTEARYRVNSGAFGAWLTADEDAVAVPGVAVGDIVTLEVRSYDAVGNLGVTASAAITVEELSDDVRDFPLGDPDTANAAVKVTLDIGDDETIEVGGLPVTVTDALGSHVTMLTANNGIASFAGLAPGEYRATPAQAGGTTVDGSSRMTVVSGQRVEHEIKLVPEGLLARSSSPSGFTDLRRCLARIPPSICAQFAGDGLRAIATTRTLFGGSPDRHLANSFQHSYGVARFTRTMLTKFREHPVKYAYDFARNHELDDRKSPDIDIRRASFMDTNNNFVGYNYTKANPTLNGAQLCNAMRTKTKYARLAHYAAGRDEVPVPPDGERTQLIYNLAHNANVDGGEGPTHVSYFPSFRPCSYAERRYDQGLDG